MHLRSKPWAGGWLTNHSDIVIDQEHATLQIGKWQSLFDQEQPIHIEIGSGKNNFEYIIVSAR